MESQDKFLNSCMDMLAVKYADTIYNIKKTQTDYIFTNRVSSFHMAYLRRDICELYNNIMQMTDEPLVLTYMEYCASYYYKYDTCVTTRFDKSHNIIYIKFLIDTLIFIIVNKVKSTDFSVSTREMKCTFNSTALGLLTCNCKAITITKLYNSIPHIKVYPVISSKSFGDMYLNEEMTDYTLVCVDGGRIAAHSLILATSSDVFKQCIKYDCIESSTKEICVDFDADVTKFVMDYIYLNIIGDTSDYEFVTELLRFVYMYDITNMIDVAANLVSDTVQDYDYINSLVEWYDNDYLRAYLELLQHANDE